MVMDSNTTLYSVGEFDQALVEEILEEVSLALKEKGYDPINQISGYLMSGDPGYISSYKDARKKIVSIDRNKILEFLLRKTLGEDK
jgi:uncharacterized protein (UPF0297 family)